MPRPLRLLLPFLLYALVQVDSGGERSSAAVVFLVACPLRDCGPDARLLWGLAWGAVALAFAAGASEDEGAFDGILAAAGGLLALLAAIFAGYSEAPAWTALSAAPLWGWLLWRLAEPWWRARRGTGSA